MIFLMIFTGLNVSVKAAPPETLQYKNFTFGNDVNLKGVFSSHSMYFDANKYLQVKSLNADIYFNISQLVSSVKYATITFSLNGSNFYSAPLSYKTGQDTQNLKISVPLRLIKSGSNQLKIETYCRISDKPCIDDVNNANWITIYGNSSLSMGFSYKSVTNNISEFPYPYSTVIAVPDNYTESELSAAFMLQSYFGNQSEDEDYNGVVMKYSKVPKDENTVYIGAIKSFPSDVKKLYSQLENQNYSDNAVIRKSGTITAVASENGDMLEKAVKLLMNKNLLSQLNSDTFILGKNIDEERKPFEQSSRLTFENLGLDTIQLKGPFRQSASVQYALPKNRVLSQGSKIKLFMRYSQNLDFNRSLLTVYLNGIPIGSKKLYKDRCNGDEVELSIPHDIKKSNYLDINMAFDLEMPGSFCQFRQEEMPWAVVTGDSNIYIPNNKVEFYSFDTYPQPFISDGKFNDTAIVVPDNLSENDIEGISRMFSYMGKDMNYNSGNLSVVKSSNFSKVYYNKNLIVYGTPENNTVVKTLNSKLWFKYNSSYNSFQGNEKLYLLKPYASNIASFQFDISPYNTERAILMITSPKQDILSRSIRFLYSSKQVLKLTGDSILIDNLGNVKTFKFKKESTSPIFDKFTSADTSTKTFIGIMVLMFIFIVIAIVLYFLKNRKTHIK